MFISEYIGKALRAASTWKERARCQFFHFIGADEDDLDATHGDDNPDKARDRRSKDGLFWLFAIAVIGAAVVFVIAVVIAILGYKAGEFGDFFGGTLNPFLTFLTFMGLLITIVLQQSELRETRRELKRSATALESQLKGTALQNFEATFFQMLTLHNTIVNSLDVKLRSGDGTARGRDAFKEMYSSLNDRYKEAKIRNTELMDDEPSAEITNLKNAWARMWDEHQSNLGHYLRYLFNIIRFVDESGDEQIGFIPNKARYMKLLRAQLSEHELMMLFYNGLTDDGLKFRHLATKYEFYRTMPNLFLNGDHRRWLSVE